MTGISIALPMLAIIALLPLPAPSAAMIEAASHRPNLFLRPLYYVLNGLIIYPILEECFYRGLLQPLLQRYLPTWVAFLVPATIFAATHIASGYINVGFAFGFGLYAAWLTHRSHSLLPSIITHVGTNLSTLFLFSWFLNPRAGATMTFQLELGVLALAVGSLVAFTAGGVILHREFLLRDTFRAGAERTLALPLLPVCPIKTEI